MDFTSSNNLITTLFIIFSTGLIGGLSPCTLPTVVFISAYVSGSQSYSKKKGFVLSLAFVSGIVLMLTILGLFAGIIGNVLMQTKILNYFIASVLILMGLWILQVINIDIRPKNLQITKKGSGIIGAFLLGIPFGIAASPCTMPITASVLAYSASKGSVSNGMMLMFIYAIGRSLPLLLVGTFTGFLNRIKGIGKYQGVIEKISGIVMIILALYFIWKA
ncbi:cytochrome c biogenesis CcdA family protein [Paramaledivibacter caminithermalis]|jgi:cytochrome c-type biogenesis protein|uniref:Cytochrome c-type biogenesis protein n=1 Tax=Paramaledivibacter caminithermalis (strain DSM 15212 / CIP 107654 / DViRD3) TaxID=1121301 RepID=A0A1M6LX87_PARC5|nr:cytochrome c biogenesis CcdA family protein [Paramaledivibacter caminithermalis]SHJ75798.1 cytochrome c-type biogenesis protein [Paramaledivibacter caminithermalis DSM 15212]